MNVQRSLFRRVTIAALALFVVGQACTLSLFNPSGLTIAPSTQSPAINIPTNTPYPVAQTTFVVTLPEPLQAGETLTIAIMDEVTGLAQNATYYPMEMRDPLTYSGVLPLPFNSVVKYRYVRKGASVAIEDTTMGTAIRYRLHYVIGPGVVTDIVADWSDKTYVRPTGMIQGRVTNADTGSPLPNIMVNAAGVQYLTDSTGRFELPGMPVGTQNLTAYSLDGMYQPFEQGALVAEGKVTDVNLGIKPNPLVSITFNVRVPADTVPGVPVRIAGNILQLGNTFADLQGGLNTNTDRMPVMNLQPDGSYSTTLRLPVGTNIQYKYTLGDGFWNAEHQKDGTWVLRDFVVPAQDSVMQDTVVTWAAGNSSPILFEVTVPSVTPPGDIIYIQLNPYGWTEPLPMWPLGNNRWAYKLYGPLNILGSFGYRYCRNAQCGSADDLDTSAVNTTGRQAITSLTGQDIQDTVKTWKWFENPEPGTLVGSTINARGAGFTAGVEFLPSYRPSWSYFAPQAFVNLQAIGSNHVVITPTWTYSSISPLSFATLPGKDPLWIDSAIMISQARNLGLNVSLFPSANFQNASSSDFWLRAPRDAQWWQTWFSRYRTFAIHYADLAQQSGSQNLILGGEWVTPAVPGGKLPDGSSPNAPADVEAQWKSIIAEARTHFSGKIYWALPYNGTTLQTTFSFLQDVDGIYVLWSAPLATNPAANKTDLANEAGRLLDNEIAPFAGILNKPFLLAVAYPSVTGASGQCIPDGKGGCADWLSLSQPNPENTSVNLNLQAQADIYEAMLMAINTRPFISGFISRGYYPPVALQDKSASIHNKPAADILWYWYPRLLGTVQ